MRYVSLMLAVALLGGCGSKAKQDPAVVERVLIISVDGLRPDVLLRATAPNIRALARRGSFTYWAQTIEPSLTLPSHVSMLTGVTPEKHGVYINLDYSYQFLHMPESKMPTIFELAKAAGYSTALISGKAKFEAIAKPGSLDWWYVPESFEEDLKVAERAASIIKEHQPKVTFVHFPSVDAAGHGSGWGSEGQIKAVEQADRAVGRVLGAVRKAGLEQTTAVILTSDHGGSGWSHWRTDEKNKHIVWIIAGPGIKKNLDLTRYPYRTISTCDTFATACYLMKIGVSEDIDGKPVLEAIDRSTYKINATEDEQQQWEYQ